MLPPEYFLASLCWLVLVRWQIFHAGFFGPSLPVTANLMLSQSVHPKVVSEMLGHSSVRLTLDTYSHVTPTMQKQATDAMEAILAG